MNAEKERGEREEREGGERGRREREERERPIYADSISLALSTAERDPETLINICPGLNSIVTPSLSKREHETKSSHSNYESS